MACPYFKPCPCVSYLLPALNHPVTGVAGRAGPRTVCPAAGSCIEPCLAPARPGRGQARTRRPASTSGAAPLLAALCAGSAAWRAVSPTLASTGGATSWWGLVTWARTRAMASRRSSPSATTACSGSLGPLPPGSDAPVAHLGRCGSGCCRKRPGPAVAAVVECLRAGKPPSSRDCLSLRCQDICASAAALRTSRPSLCSHCLLARTFLCSLAPVAAFFQLPPCPEHVAAPLTIRFCRSPLHAHFPACVQSTCQSTRLNKLTGNSSSMRS